jgi:hypothetical protein
MKRRLGAEKLLAAELEHARRNTDAAGGNIRLRKLQVAGKRLYESSHVLHFASIIIMRTQESTRTCR